MSRKCRVAHLIYSSRVGGSEMVALNICSGLDSTRFAPHLISLCKSEDEIRSVPGIETVEHVNFNLPWRSLPLEKYYVACRLCMLQLDVLHVHHIPLFLRILPALRLAGIKRVLLTEHAKYSIQKSEYLLGECKNVVEHVDYFTTISENLREFFVTEAGTDPAKIEVIPNGVDTCKFNPLGTRASFSSCLPENFSGKVLLSIGRLVDAKDFPGLLSTVKMIRERGGDVFLAIAGDGEMKRELSALVESLEISSSVVLLGNRKDIPELLRTADIFLISSKREGLPMVMFEAMASALPLISTKVGGIPEVLSDGVNSILVEPGNPQALADAVMTLIEEPAVAARMGESARQTVCDHYSISTVCSRYQELYTAIS